MHLLLSVSKKKGTGKKMTQSRLQQPAARAVLTVLTVAVMILIFVFSTETAEKSDKTSGFFSDAVIRILHPAYDSYSRQEQEKIYLDTQFAVRKAAHFTEYMILGALLRLCIESWTGKRKNLWLISWGAGVLYACTDELHQLMTSGRSGQWQDVLLDGIGVLGGILVIRLLRRKRKGEETCP